MARFLVGVDEPASVAVGHVADVPDGGGYVRDDEGGIGRVDDDPLVPEGGGQHAAADPGVGRLFVQGGSGVRLGVCAGLWGGGFTALRCWCGGCAGQLSFLFCCRCFGVVGLAAVEAHAAHRFYDLVEDDSWNEECCCGDNGHGRGGYGERTEP